MKLTSRESTAIHLPTISLETFASVCAPGLVAILEPVKFLSGLIDPGPGKYELNGHTQ